MTVPVTVPLAVYGSLMRADGMLARLGAEPHLKFLGPATIAGRLFDLGEYPGLRVDIGDGRVPAELFAILDPEGLRILDSYEGYDPAASPASPAPPSFERRQLKLVEPSIEAWVYVYTGSVDGCPAIVGMNWPDYKASRRNAHR